MMNLFERILLLAEKPKIYLDNLLGKKIKVRAGEPINVSIPISGAPTPTCEWSVNDKKLVETKRVLVRAVPLETFSMFPIKLPFLIQKRTFLDEYW